MTKKSWHIMICFSLLFALCSVDLTRSNIANATGNIYYVSTSGDDNANNGLTLGAPFQTIQKAASLAQAGDTVYIRGGTYRETVTPAYSGSAGNPITFQNYNGETVNVSGGDLVTVWTQHAGSVYKAPMNWTINSGDGDIIYVDGQPAHEARWPNASDPLLRSGFASVDSGTGSATEYTITDAALSSFAPGYWNGAKVYAISGHEYYAFISTITNHEGSPTNKLHFAPFAWTSSGYYPTGGNEYYIFHSLNALDQQMEWYRDSATNTLYLWVPGGDSPANHIVEAKSRNYAIDLSNKSYITFSGVNAYGAQITTNGGSHSTIAKAIIETTDLDYSSQSSPEFARGQGILLGGTYNTVRDSEIKNMYGNAITMSGSHNSVINNYIHDVTFEASNAAPIQADGSNQLISHNTVNRASRGLIRGFPRASSIQYNDFSIANLTTTDSGVLALGNGEYQNTQIHHNRIHDNKAPSFAGGLYADAFTENLIMYKNVIYNINPGLLLNSPSNFNLVFNNTVYNASNLQNGAPNSYAGDTYGDKVYNNIISSVAISGEADVTSNQIFTNCSYVNTASYDFRLQSGSACIDGGRVIGGVTDGYVGNQPDVGAFEFGGVDWTAGHNFSSPPNPTFALNEIEYSNRVNDGGFESGTLASWTSAAGSPSLATGASWDYKTNSMSRMHKKAAYLEAGDKIEQTITGLQPNTNYVFSAWAKINGLTTQAEDYSSGSGSAHWDYTNGDFRVYRDAKYVGPMQNDDYLVFNNIDFGATAKYNKLSAGINTTVDSGSIEIRLGSTTGTLLGTVDLANYDSIWKWQDTDISAATGMQDVYLVFKGTGNIALFDGFKLWNSNMADDVTLGVTNYGGTDVTTSVNSTSWGSSEYQIKFTTGATNTSATVYVNKPDGDYSAYIDNVGLLKDHFITKTALEDDGFESGTSKWATGRGTSTTTTAEKHLGDSSFPINDDTEVIYQKATSKVNKVATLWFYDDAADTSVRAQARVDDAANWNENGTTWRSIGVDTNYYPDHYFYRIDGTLTNSNIARSTGWHEFKWDYTSGTKVDMYIDGTLIASPAGVTAFSLVAMGDWSGSSITGNVYFDDFTTQSTALINDGFEFGFGNWTIGNGTASSSTSVYHGGSKSYAVDQDMDVIYQKVSSSVNKIATLWFYDDAVDTGMKTFARVDNGTWNDSTGWRGIGVDTPTSVTNYVYRVGGTVKATTIPRLSGWHEFKWDYTSGTKVDMYIDGTLIASPTGTTAYSMVAMGDWWRSTSTGDVYFDDFKAYTVDFTDGFESGFANWTTVNGTASTGTPLIPKGSYSYEVNEDMDVIQHAIGATTNQVGVVWFYDDATDNNLRTSAFVDKGTSSTQVGLGVDTPTSTSKYVYRVGSTNTATTIDRTTGWHQLVFDYRSGTDVKLYIDETLVKTSTSQTGFDVIRLGDYWGGGSTGTVYFDDISVQSELP
ncbi:MULTISPECIES: carbohydrate-binding protein [unclassified Paenibacillus]|uniref:carbohydrate-binding protein n=1 Tax=unclassified Paenibacillus TaxID=185978 RepID=UPI002788CD02|nr:MULTISPECIES: carbohydrate-binding protein [unclassified Paenibacillus]MDQ0897889.1 hypothetical protein [Paenibacillus sp. V4I7]MDQ0916116.1 hypothetical protein [Paenibacillus sp. V4I5]